MLKAIPNFLEGSLFTSAKKAALRLADAMVGDHKQAPYDEIFADLRKYVVSSLRELANPPTKYCVCLHVSSCVQTRREREVGRHTENVSCGAIRRIKRKLSARDFARSICRLVSFRFTTS
jgi:hypothetical protein